MPCFLANDRDAMFGTSLSRSLCLNTKSKRNTWSALCLFAIAPRMSITSTDIQRTLCNDGWPSSALPFEPLQADLRRYQAAIGVRKLR